MPRVEPVTTTTLPASDPLIVRPFDALPGARTKTAARAYLKYARAAEVPSRMRERPYSSAKTTVSCVLASTWPPSTGGTSAPAFKVRASAAA